ncbi:MAG: BBP7 family outer membrane beta-barrel protein [Pirellulaceae bacterium]
MKNVIQQPFLLVAIVLAGSWNLSIATAQQACDAIGCCDSARGWSIGATALFLDRVDEDARLFSGPNGNFDADEFGLGYQAGYQLTGRYDFNEDLAFITRWMSVDQWSERHGDLNGPPATATLNAATVFNFPGTTFVNGIHSAALHSLELGFSRRLINDLHFTTSFRYLEIDDQFDFSLDAGILPTTVRTNARNRLYGGQIGLQSTLLRHGRWSIDGLSQIGIFGNSASQSTGVRTGAARISTAGQTDEASFLAELGINGRHHLTNHLSFVAGYQLMWVTSLAAAPNELLTTNLFVPSIAADSNVFYHGASVGFELAY